MKSRIIRLSFLLAGITAVVTFTAFKQASKPWPVPDKFQKMVSPVKADAASLKEGKELWTKHCASCHGKSGLGDGSKAAQCLLINIVCLFSIVCHKPGLITDEEI